MKKHGQSIIRQLRLYLDDDGCIRSAGRIHNAHLPEATKFPLLLPPKAHLSMLIINDAHIRQLHAFIQKNDQSSTQKVLDSIYSTESWTHYTSLCELQKNNREIIHCAVPTPLPTSRVTYVRPFAVTGFNYSNALHVNTDRRQQQKVYICLFT